MTEGSSPRTTAPDFVVGAGNGRRQGWRHTPSVGREKQQQREDGISGVSAGSREAMVSRGTAVGGSDVT